MNDIPVIAFAAWSGTGKTTFIEKLITEFRSRSIRVAVIKHDAHDFEIDHEGKDSYRFAHAGADVTVIASKEKTALVIQRSLDLNNIISMVSDVDLIILEGYNNEDVPRIGISRAASKKGFRHPLSSYIAVVTDEVVTADIPVFGLNDISAAADFIINNVLR